MIVILRGWVTESVDTNNRVCARMSQSTGHIVVSVEYRLAPEYRFPTALMDCYAAAKALYTNKLILNTDPRKITIMGDSAVLLHRGIGRCGCIGII